MGTGGKDEVQTCSAAESCHPDTLHRMRSLSAPWSDVCGGNLTITASSLNAIRPFSGALSVGVRLMSWKSCGVSNMISLKKVICKSSSRGALIRAKIASKYSLAPLNLILVRLGRIARVSGGGCWLSRAGRGRGDRNRRLSSSRLVNAERLVAIASGGMYPELGISNR